MNVHLVTFACWRYEASRRRLVRSARKFGISRCHNFSPADFKATPAYSQYPEVSGTYRGAGLWLWKPLFILRVFDQMADDDCLIYLDSGAEIIAPLEPLIALCEGNHGIALFTVHGRLNRQWTKRDCFVLMGCDEPKYHDEEQTMSTIIILRKTPFVRNILEEWFRYCSDVRIVSDQPNTCGLPNLDGFVENRHDQSILANLRIKHGLRAFTDPSQFGNPFRDQATKGVDDYPALLDLHREKLPSWRNAVRLLLKDRRHFLQTTRKHLFRLLSGRWF